MGHTATSGVAPHVTNQGSGVRGATIICFSHLRWAFVFQRPQHLMSRFARNNRVLFWEEPEIDGSLAEAKLELSTCSESGVTVVTPKLPPNIAPAQEHSALRRLLDTLLEQHQEPLVRWYYTPMMLPFSGHLAAACTVYDCMDELANFKNAPAELTTLENELFAAADLVFTGGHSLYEAKRDAHADIYPFPSAVDVPHFARARLPGADPDDQAGLARPRLGFYGVIDERMNLDLLAALADARPEYTLIMVGPVVKISEADLPRRPNLHYPGAKTYAELPDTLRGWDVALMPFAINEATRFISPTKTPEYLAAGRPVVSTPIADVVRHFGTLEAVQIAATAEEFATACDAALALPKDGAWLDAVDTALAEISWDRTSGRTWRTLIGDSVVIGKHRGSAGHLANGVAWPDRVQSSYDVMIVGGGICRCGDGRTAGERGSGKRVLVVDRRPHVGGNAYDRKDAAGILMHQYGPHIFHTNSERYCRLSFAVHGRGAPTNTACWQTSMRHARADADQPHDAEHAVRSAT